MSDPKVGDKVKIISGKYEKNGAHIDGSEHDKYVGRIMTVICVSKNKSYGGITYTLEGTRKDESSDIWWAREMFEFLDKFEAHKKRMLNV